MMATIKYMRIMQSKFTNTPPPPKKKKIQTVGRAPGAPVLDPPLELNRKVFHSFLACTCTCTFYSV